MPPPTSTLKNSLSWQELVEKHAAITSWKTLPLTSLQFSQAPPNGIPVFLTPLWKKKPFTSVTILFKNLMLFAGVGDPGPAATPALYCRVLLPMLLAVAQS